MCVYFDRNAKNPAEWSFWLGPSELPLLFGLGQAMEHLPSQEMAEGLEISAFLHRDTAPTLRIKSVPHRAGDIPGSKAQKRPDDGVVTDG